MMNADRLFMLVDTCANIDEDITVFLQSSYIMKQKLMKIL